MRCSTVVRSSFHRPLLQAKADVSLPTDVAHSGNSAREKVAELFDEARRRVGFARSLLHIAFRQRIGQVRVQIDESRKNGFARNVRYFGVRGHAVDEAGKILKILLRAMTSVARCAAASVPSTRTRSGPLGPGFTGMRRGSPLTGVDGSKD